MARRIRRNSMEHLQLYDLDEITRVPTPYQLPPPLPPPRKLRHYGTTKPTFERYRFLCDAERHKTDPIYAATPMFTTIPQSSKHVHQRRQLLGSRIPSDIIKPVSSSTPKSTEPQTAETEDDKEEEDEEEEKEQEEEEEEEKKKKKKTRKRRNQMMTRVMMILMTEMNQVAVAVVVAVMMMVSIMMMIIEEL